MTTDQRQNLLVVAGAVIGGVVGYAAFFLLYRAGYYAVALPGGLLGIGAGCFKTRNTPLCLACAAGAALLGLLAEWRRAPFGADPGLGYFLLHVTDLSTITLIMVALGAGIGFWGPYRRRHLGSRTTTPPAT